MPRWKPLDERFWARVDKSGECWTWTGALTTPGYGTITDRGQQILAHRYSWQTAFGNVPDGWDLHHVCETKACVRPSHLRQVTKADHVRLHRQRGHRSHCRHGHAYDEANTYMWRGQKQCRACWRASARVRYWRARGVEILRDSADAESSRPRTGV